MGNMQPDLTNMLDPSEMKDQNLYNRISMNVPQMKTFYQKPNPVPAVAPYATTTLINTSNLLGKPLQVFISFHMFILSFSMYHHHHHHHHHDNYFLGNNTKFLNFPSEKVSLNIGHNSTHIDK